MLGGNLGGDPGWPGLFSQIGLGLLGVVSSGKFDVADWFEMVYFS
jgi:hypothetical protein